MAKRSATGRRRVREKQGCEDVEVRVSLGGGTLSAVSSFPVPDWPRVFMCGEGPISGLQLKLRRGYAFPGLLTLTRSPSTELKSSPGGLRVASDPLI